MKKSILLLTFSIIFFSNAFSQQDKIDSLKQDINSATQDTVRIKTYLKLGKVFQNSILDSSLFYYEKGLEIAENIEEKKLIAKCCRSIGVVFFYQRNYSSTLEYWKKALKLNEELGEKSSVSANLANIGLVYRRQSNYLKSLEFYQKSLSLKREIGNQEWIAKDLKDLGFVYYGLSNSKKTIECWKESLNIYEKSGHYSGIAANLGNLGIVYKDLSNFAKALEYSKKSLELDKQLGDESAIAKDLINIGVVYFYKKNHPKALKYWRESLQISERLGDQLGIATSYGNIGNVYSDQRNYVKALEYLNKSLEINKKLDRKLETAATLGGIGLIYSRLENYQKSIEYQQKALKINEEISFKPAKAINLINLGSLFLKESNYLKAIEFYQKSLKLNEELGAQTEVAVCLAGLGNLYNDKKDYVEAQSFLHKALKLSREIGLEEASYHHFLATSHWALNNVSTAANYLDTMLIINNKNILLNFTILPESAKQLYYAGVEQDYWRYNSFILDNRDSFPSMNGRVYNSTVKNKGLLLKSNTAMRNAIYASKDSSLIGAYDDWIVLKTQIAKKYANGEDATVLNNKADSLEGNLVKNSNEFSDFKKTQNIDWKQVQNGLKEHEVAIEFTHFPLLNPDSSYTDFTNEVQYVALLIDKKSEYPKMIPLFKEKQLEEVLGKLAGNNYSYINEVYGTQSKENKALYNLIWKPIEKQVQGATKVYLSPSGLLHKISFSAIAKSQNVYLCDAYDIEVKSSTGKITDRENQRQELNTASLYGGVVYDTDKTDQKIWKYLDGTKTETDNISKVLTKGKLDVNYFSSTGATEEKFKETAENSNILHIATHGFFYPDPNKVQEEAEKNTEYGDITFRGNQGYGVNSFVESRNPLMRSGLALAGANDVWSQQVKNDSIEDGVLTAEEVSNIDLRKTELVVMSACESGLGDIQGSEGVYGLQRSFKMAGVDFIIMSLWQVPDKETEEFMTIFYKNLAKKKDIKKAFSKTQKAMRKKYDPYFWAAFVLVE